MPLISFDRHSLILDATPTLIRSGAMHYFRLPHPDLWWDRLKKLKAAGYNTVDLYFSWDFHSKSPGEYDFTGVRDVKRLLDMVQDLGLYWIGRPGPYINAETTRGGLPGWLITQPDVILRNRIDGEYHASPQYMAFVAEWFNHILPFLKGRDNLLMIQVENEYSTLEMEPDYMQALIDIIRNHGIHSPTMHNDFYAAGLYADLVDIYAVDNYSVTAFDWNWRTFPDVFSVIDHLEANIREEFCPNRPLMMAELQAGWFAGWKSASYAKIKQALGRDHIAMVTRSFLGQGGTIFNHYKAIGGTNWDDIGATDAYTSYDFAAPISEEGLPTERLYEAKRINLFLSHFDITQTEPASLDFLPSSKTLYKIRRSSEAYWIFTRNLSPEPVTFQLSPHVSVETPPYHAAILPYHLPLNNGWVLEEINVEPLIQTTRLLVLPAEGQTTLLIQSPQPLTFEPTPGIQVTTLPENRYWIQLEKPLGDTQLLFLDGPQTRILFLGQDLVDRLWQTSSTTYLIGPDMAISPEEAYLSSPRNCWLLSHTGELTPLVSPEIAPLKLPVLKDWQWVSEPLPQEGFQPLSPKGADMDANGLYGGAAWYQYEYTGHKEVLALHAQHIWAVFLNGHCLISDHTFHVHPETTGPEDVVTLQLPTDLQNSTQPNHLTIFVESLGHHKGFHDDTRDPRGILSLALDGEEIARQGGIQPALAKGMVHGTTLFDLDMPDTVKAPMGLSLEMPIERVNITLNGVLIGKYWRSCNNQTLFYLPEGVLNLQGTNRLTLTCMNFLPPLTVENPLGNGYSKVELVPFAVLSKLSP